MTSPRLGQSDRVPNCGLRTFERSGRVVVGDYAVALEYVRGLVTRDPHGGHLIDGGADEIVDGGAPQVVEEQLGEAGRGARATPRLWTEQRAHRAGGPASLDDRNSPPTSGITRGSPFLACSPRNEILPASRKGQRPRSQRDEPAAAQKPDAATVSILPMDIQIGAVTATLTLASMGWASGRG